MTDWLARRRGGIIDFRLPGDPSEIPSQLLLARTEEYYRQLYRQMRMTALKAAARGVNRPKL